MNYDPAEDIYAAAEKEMMNDRYDSSLVKLKYIYSNYPNSPLAPKALYASGWIMENELDNSDSAAALYDSLKQKYPATVYANEISDKVKLYNQEQQRIAKAREDSLKKIEALKADSLVRTDSLGVKSQPEDTVRYKNPSVPKPGITNDSIPNGAAGDSLQKNIPEVIDSLRPDNFKGRENLQKETESVTDSLNTGANKRRK